MEGVGAVGNTIMNFVKFLAVIVGAFGGLVGIGLWLHRRSQLRGN